MSYSTISYSQEGEDLLLKRIFAGQAEGFYIDVGALHPERFSNTKLFYDVGWHGINIDATPNSMQLFEQQRQRDINICAFVHNENKEFEYYLFNEPALNTFDKALADSYVDAGYVICNSLKTNSIALSNILELHLPKNKEIDFLTIDVENADYAVLLSNSWNKYKPKIVLIEILYATIESVLNGKESFFLKQHGYTFYAKTVNTCFFIRDDFYKYRFGIK